ncbi:photosynthetic complex putative assembly protein PuhB [Skermanella stibiiresistens]|nr:photosynthetic complex putative assembly protein PuhB [Skermanella stibiiresistens]
MMTEHEVEPVRGLPTPLPPGETMLWQGSPDWVSLARRGMHLDTLAIYFGVLLAWRGFSVHYDGATVLEAALSTLRFAPWAICALMLVLLFAWGVARTTVYTITDKRVVLRFGIALPMAINLPFKLVTSAAVKLNSDGTGDIPLALTGGNRVAWLVLWPHARAWRVSQPEPMLRAIPEAARVAGILAEALTAATAGVGIAANAEPARIGAAERKTRRAPSHALGSAST